MENERDRKKQPSEKPPQEIRLSPPTYLLFCSFRRFYIQSLVHSCVFETSTLNSFSDISVPLVFIRRGL